MYDRPLTLNGPVQLVLQPQTVGVILDLIGQLPFKQAEPIMREVWSQLVAREDQLKLDLQRLADEDAS
jgi:hypothetical protein